MAQQDTRSIAHAEARAIRLAEIREKKAQRLKAQKLEERIQRHKARVLEKKAQMLKQKNMNLPCMCGNTAAATCPHLLCKTCCISQNNMPCIRHKKVHEQSHHEQSHQEQSHQESFIVC